MSWLKKHLNWSWPILIFGGYIAICTVFISILYLITFFGYDVRNLGYTIGQLTGFIWPLIVSGWILKQKNRSLWWLLLACYLSPIWLGNYSVQTNEINQE